jgi:glycosyltransferase involved in cell wall biosynthesis
MAKNKLSQTESPLISVIMSVYNGGDYLRASIDSILAQTYRNFELIIINDGSTDNSDSIIKSYNDERILLVRQLNHGLVYSLNKAIGIASGTYIARQDADDISLPSRFEKELQLLTSNTRLGVVSCYFTYVDEITLDPSVTISGPTLNTDIKRAMYFTNPFGHGAVMMRRKIFDTIAPYSADYGPTEDFELWRRIADEWDLAIVPESLYFYRLNSAGISSSKSDLQHEYTADLIAEQWKKPFVFKSMRDIINDGKYYRTMHSLQAKQVYGVYVSQQVDIARALFYRGWFKPAFATAYASWRLAGVGPFRYIKPVMHGIEHRIRRLL